MTSTVEVLTLESLAKRVDVWRGEWFKGVTLVDMDSLASDLRALAREHDALRSALQSERERARRLRRELDDLEEDYDREVERTATVAAELRAARMTMRDVTSLLRSAVDSLVIGGRSP